MLIVCSGIKDTFEQGSKCTILAQQRLTGFQLFNSLVLDTFKVKFTHKKNCVSKIYNMTQLKLRPQ